MFIVLALLAGSLALGDPREDSDLAAARALFEQNVHAIQERDHDAYLGCYLASERLVMTGPEGFRRGFDVLAEGTPPTGSEEWPAALIASDLRLAWIRAGVVYGTYRYRVSYDGNDWAAGISERFFLETEEGWRIAVSTAFASTAGTPAPPMALVGATLHDGSGGPPLEDAAVLIRGGRIERVGRRNEVLIPVGVDIVDFTGKHLVPGLVDTHVHYSQTGWADGRPDAFDVRSISPYEVAMAENEAHPERFHLAFLASGITAVFDVGGYPWTRRLGEAVETDPFAPHVAACGPLIATFDPEVLSLPDAKQMIVPDDEAQARAFVRAHAAAGSDAIKLWFVVQSDDDVREWAGIVHAVGRAAEELGLPLVVHATNLEAARVAVDAGASLLVHSVEDRTVDDAFVESCRARGTFYCPTLTVRAGYRWLHERVVPDELRSLLDLVHPSVRERVERTEALERDVRSAEVARSLAQRGAREREITYSNLRRMRDAGVRVVLGTDAGNPLTLHGPSVFAELEAKHAAGLTPVEVLVAATSHAAAAMGREDDLGRVASGYVADLVVLDADPSADVRALRSITHVIRAGTLHEREHLLPR